MAQVTFNDIIANQTIRIAVLEAEKQELVESIKKLQIALQAATEKVNIQAEKSAAGEPGLHIIRMAPGFEGIPAAVPGDGVPSVGNPAGE